VDIKVLLQALGRPWFIEESQANHWAGIAAEMVSTRRMDAVPNNDTRKDEYGYSAYEFPRVNANGDLTADGEVQLVRIEGPVMKYSYCGSLGMEQLQQGIRAANADPTIKSIVLLIDSPGGTVDGTHNLAREVKASKKPVVSFVNGMMCSAAYWIGSSASEIIADDANNGYNATIGSIGTMAMWKDKSKAEEAAGIKTHIVFATKSKRKGAFSQEANSGNYERLITELDNLNETFLSSVKQNRGSRLKMEEEDVLEGDVYDAKAALKHGLIDKIGNLQYAIKRSLQLAKTIK
jgi:signal peptide peptidase SppA